MRPISWWKSPYWILHTELFVYLRYLSHAITDHFIWKVGCTLQNQSTRKCLVIYNSFSVSTAFRHENRNFDLIYSRGLGGSFTLPGFPPTAILPVSRVNYEWEEGTGSFMVFGWVTPWWRPRVAHAVRLRVFLDISIQDTRSPRNYTDGLMQERRNSIANALELRLSCSNQSIHCWYFLEIVEWLETDTKFRSRGVRHVKMLVFFSGKVR